MKNPYDQFEANPYDQFEGVNPIVEAGGQLAQGIVKGIPNLIDTGAALVATGADKALGVSDKSLGDTFQQYAEQRPVSTAVDAVLGTQEVEPQTDLGRYANMAGQGVAAAPLFAGATVSNMVRGGLGGFGAESGADVGQAVGGDVGGVVGALVGGVAGGIAPDAVKAIGPLTKRAQTAFGKAIAPTIDQSTAVLAQRAQQMGVPLALNQVDPTRLRNTAQKVSQAIPLSGVRGFEEGQRTAWNKALSKTIGMDADKLSPEMVGQFLGNVNKGYADALKGTTVRIKSDQIAQLDDIAREASMSLGDDMAKTVAKNIDYVKSQLANGFIRGEKADSIRKEMMRRASSGAFELKDTLGEVATKLTDIIADSIPQQNAEAIRGLNRQYRNFKTVEPLLEKSVDGSINPTDLLQRVASSKFIKASRAAVGDDELVDLSRIGKLMPKLGGSDTFEKGGLVAGGAAAVTQPLATAAVVGGNRAYQALYNQSQNLLKNSVDKSLPKGVGEALQTGDVGKIISAAGGVTAAQNLITRLASGGNREAKKEAFELSKQMRKTKKDNGR